MKILKKIAIAIVVVLLLMLVIGLFLPSKFEIERSLVMKAQPATIYEQINNVKNGEKWSPWLKMDPEIKLTYNDIPSGVGASFSWTSPNKQTGSGTSTITEVKEYDFINTKLDMQDDNLALSGYKFEPSEGGTKVSWWFKSDVGKNPLKRWMIVIMNGKMKSIFDQGLNDIKTIVESMPPPAAKPEYKTEVTTVNETNYLAVRDSGDVVSIGMKMGKDYGMIGKAIEKQKLKMAGAPFAITYTYSPTNWIFDAAMPVDKAGKADGNVKPGILKAGNAVVTHFTGDYKMLSAGYDAVNAFIKANNKKIIGNPWEVYITDPMTEKDTTKWQTDIYFPVE